MSKASARKKQSATRKRKDGFGKRKGGQFERVICKELSLWVSGGKDKDLFWRSAMSGGRATVAAKSGDKLTEQCGDVCSVSPKGHTLTDLFFIECKHVRNLRPDLFLFRRGLLYEFWSKAKKDALAYGKQPMLIARDRIHMPMVFTLEPVKGTITSAIEWEVKRDHVPAEWCEYMFLADLLKVKYPYALR